MSTKVSKGMGHGVIDLRGAVSKILVLCLAFVAFTAVHWLSEQAIVALERCSPPD